MSIKGVHLSTFITNTTPYNDGSVDKSNKHDTINCSGVNLIKMKFLISQELFFGLMNEDPFLNIRKRQHLKIMSIQFHFRFLTIKSQKII